MTTRDLVADQAEVAVCCESEAGEPDNVYCCSRCGMEYRASELDGPPFRCPGCHVFMANTGTQVCTECEAEWEGTEWAEVWRCPDCGGTFDTDGAEHVCTDADREAEEARRQAGVDESMRRYRASIYPKVADVIHTAEALRALGFTVRTEGLVGPGPDYDALPDDDGGVPWDENADVVLSTSGGSLLRTDEGSAFRRLVGLIAGQVAGTG